MPPDAPAGWTLRLIDLLGGRLDEVAEAHLERLVTGSVREDADLDFKQQRYGNSDQEKRELAADLAAMGNGRGGLLVIGVRDESDVAVELTPVELPGGEEARVRQVAASNIAPHLPFTVRVIESAQDPGRGYYLFIVPPSSLRPHAVVKGRDLRYPLRDGTTTRWLAESEVADRYRDRFTVAAGQAGRLDWIVGNGLAVMNLSEDAFLAVALVPTAAGSMPIDRARVATLREWARDRIGAIAWFDGFFDGNSPRAGVAAHRVTLTTSYSDEPPRWVYVELYDDGAGFACCRLPDPRRGPVSERPGTWIFDEQLLFSLARSLRLLGRHAGENCGAWGDALIQAQVVGEEPSRLAYVGRFRQVEEIAGGRELLSPVVSRHTAVIEALARPGAELLVTTRLLATDLFHAYGSPEVRQITADGQLRVRYISGIDTNLREWADRYGVGLTEEALA